MCNGPNSLWDPRSTAPMRPACRKIVHSHGMGEKRLHIEGPRDKLRRTIKVSGEIVKQPLDDKLMNLD